LASDPRIEDETKVRGNGAPVPPAKPSPFPPIADYAFLSNCHTGALVAPDGSSTGCACRASTRPACSAPARPRRRLFRLGPFGDQRPDGAHYEPGTNVLDTTWKTPAGGSWCATR
jgi:hypothetical protein